MLAAAHRPLAAPESAAGAVTPRLVHKSDPGEVYLVRWRRTAPDSFRISARWPRSHPFYRMAPEADPLLLCETIRQTFPLLCHAAYEVPVGHQLIWERFSYRFEPPAPGVPASESPELELHVDCHDLVRRGALTVALSMRFLITRGGRPFARAETRFTVQSPAVYRRLRGARGDAARVMAAAPPAPAPLPHRVTGRTRPRDVVLAPAGRETATGAGPAGWLLRVDPAHPVLFDHPVDHVPGMLLLEAAHQCAQRSAGGSAVILGLECVFSRYVELDAPCLITAGPATPDDAPALAVAAVQSGETRFTATVTHTLPAPPATHRGAA